MATEITPTTPSSNGVSTGGSDMSTPRTLTGAEIVLECLLREGVDTIFGYPGGANLPLYQQLPKYADRVEPVLLRHEQGGAHAADGYARSRRGTVGVVWATSGPGALNRRTALQLERRDGGSAGA